MRATALFLVSFLLISCSEEEEGLQREWFPLQVGTRWIYDAMADSVISEHAINGHTYYQLAGSSLPLGQSLVRMNDQGQLVALRGDSEYVLFDFESPVGTAWDVLGSTMSIVNRNVPNVVVPAGSFSGCYLFFFDSGMIDGDWIFVVAPEVGVLFKAGGFGFNFRLVSMDP